MVKRSFLILTVTFLFLLNTASYVPSGLAAGGQTLYGCAHTGAGTQNPGPSTLYTIDPLTGAATAVGLMGITGCSGLAFSLSGILFAVGIDPSTNHESLFTVNLVTGAATLVGRSDQSFCGARITDLSFRPSDGKLFGYSSGCVGMINTTTGEFTDLGLCTTSGTYSSCGFPDGNALGFSPSSLLFYSECCDKGSDTTTLYTINQATGTASVVATVSGFPAGCPNENDPTAFDFSTAGTLFGALKCNLESSGDSVPAQGTPPAFYLFTINTSTGAIIFTGGTVSGLDGIAFTVPASIPEYPLGLPLVALFMVIVYGLIKRKASSNVPG